MRFLLKGVSKKIGSCGRASSRGQGLAQACEGVMYQWYGFWWLEDEDDDWWPDKSADGVVQQMFNLGCSIKPI